MNNWYVWRDGIPFEGPYPILDAVKRYTELKGDDRHWEVRRFIAPPKCPVCHEYHDTTAAEEHY